MALFRALESSLPEGRRLFYDPYAVHLLPRPGRLLARAARFPPLGAAIRGTLDRLWPGARSAGVARTRTIDEAVLGALLEGADQVVLLGSGFDARAHRLRELRLAKVFELDRQGTLAAKRARLNASGLPLSDRVVWVEADLARRPVLEALGRQGFDATRPAVFVWEGVTNNLDPASVHLTLRALASCRAGSVVIFT